jgi:hypothetical protein
MKNHPTHIMRTLQAMRSNLTDFPSTKLVYNSISMPVLLDESNISYLLTLIELDLNGKDMSKMRAHDIRLFEASTLLRLMTLGFVIHREQFGPSTANSIIHSKAYQRIFADVHASWLFEHEDFAKELVEKSILSLAAFAAMKFNPGHQQESNKVKKAIKMPNTNHRKSEKESSKEADEEEAIIAKRGMSKKRKRREQDDEEKSEQADEEKNDSMIRKGAFKCIDVDCNKVYTNRANMQQHYLAAHKNRDYLCTHPGCDKTFRRKNNMKRHVERTHHLTAAIFVCQKCNVICSTEFNLRRHISYMHE